MATTATRYDELCDLFPLRPITSERAHKKAIDTLISLATENDRDARDYKTVLTRLVADYEHEAGHKFDISKVTPADVIRHLLEQRDMSVNALAREIGVSQGTLNETLLGKRAWSNTLIGKLADYFDLSTDLFFER